MNLLVIIALQDMIDRWVDHLPSGERRRQSTDASPDLVIDSKWRVLVGWHRVALHVILVAHSVTLLANFRPM